MDTSDDFLTYKLEIVLDGLLGPDDYMDAGYFKLRCEDRSYVYDISQQYTNTKNGKTHIECKLAELDEEEREDFSDYKFDLKDDDFFSDALTTLLWVEGECSEDITFTITLEITLGERSRIIKVDEG